MFSKKVHIICIVSLFLLSTALVANNSLRSQAQQKIFGNDTTTGDFFGSSVSIDGDTLLVGAFYDDEPQVDSGAAFIFKRSSGTWSQTAKLVSNDPASSDGMGFDVSLAGSVAVLGAPWDDLTSPSSGTMFNAGSATIFEDDGSGWVYKQKVFASDALALDNLGWGVSTDGSLLAVGAPKADIAGTSDAGAVYIFGKVSGVWVEQAKITAPTPASSEEFGRSVGLMGNTIFVGAWRSDAAAGDAGAVYVFQESNSVWSYQQTLTASDAASGDGFGEYLAVDNDLLLIGSWLSDDSGSASGSAYIFRLNSNTDTWEEEEKLVPSDGASGDRLGFRLDISNGIAAIGARNDDHSGLFDSGSTYLFKEINGSWQQLTKLIANDAQSEDNMGIGVAISVDTVVSSAERTDQSGTDSGSVYLDAIPSSPPTPTPQPLAEVTQIAPFDQHNTGALTYEWLEETNATSYTLAIYDVGADVIVFSETYSNSVCTSNNCTVQPQNLSLSAGSYTWLVRPVNEYENGPWSTYTSGSCGGLEQEAELGNLNNFFEIVNDNNASGAQYIHVPQGTGNEWFGPVAGKQADFCFNVGQAGTYRINAVVQGIDSESDAFFITVDGSPVDGYLWDIAQSGSFVQDYVSDRGQSDPVEVVLSAGLHTVSVFLREDGARLDKIELELAPPNDVVMDEPMRERTADAIVSGSIHLEDGLTLSTPITVRLSDLFSYGLDYLELATTDVDGSFAFSSVPPGHYNVQILISEEYDLIGPSMLSIEVIAYTGIQLAFDIKKKNNFVKAQSAYEPTVETFIPLVR